MKKILLILIIFLIYYSSSFAQELNCTVSIVSPKNQNIDPRVFKNLESAMMEFMNGRKWTNDNFKEIERIKCNISINISEIPIEGEYKGTAIIQSQRPVFNSNYNSLMLNLQDKTFDFAYADLQNIEYNDNGFSSQLSSLMAYYAYLIIGYDYESFSKEGGTPYFLKAQTVANNVPSTEKTKYKGWSQFDGGGLVSGAVLNRYVLIDNWLNPRYKKFREAFYSYNFNGLDKLYVDVAQARNTITIALTMLQSINTDNPSQLALRNFFLAKSNELINIYSKSDMSERAIATTLLSVLDPINTEKYKQIGKN